MWPWEHAAFGYLCYSLYRHGRHRASPGDGAAAAVVFAALLPDLLDKPLSWAVGLFPTGYAVGHSVFVWLALLGVVAGSRRGDRRDLDVAFVIGYGSHLLGDIVYPALLGESLAIHRVLWPVVTLPPYEDRLGLLARTVAYLHRYLARVLAGEVSTAVAIQAGLVLFVLGLWLFDGAPGLGIGRSSASSELSADGSRSESSTDSRWQP